MDDGAIAGTVVGVVVAVALLVFCLYPVVVHHFKRRRHADRPHFDPEAAIAAHQGSPPGADLGSHRRRSSSDSFKHDDELSRGDIGATRSKEYGWTSHDGSIGHAEDNHAPSRQMSSTGPDVAASDRSLAVAQSLTGEYELQSSPSPLPFYVGEYMPESEVHDDNPGVLKGTSADYYSPSIPSEAFGMITTPPDLHIDVPRAGRSGSRSSSLRYNVRHMFRRKSGRDNTLDSYISTSAGDNQSALAGLVELHGATALQHIVTNEDLAESPTEVSPTMTMSTAPAPRPTGSPTNLPPVSPPPSSAMTPPQAQLAERSFKHSPSPPACPAPGTVNPMDIMPATTESEVWHRTEHQLFVSSYGSPEGFSPPPEHYRNAEYASIVKSPSPTTSMQPRATRYAQSPTPTEMRVHVKQEHAEDHDIAMTDAHVHDNLTPSTIPESGRHPSYPSDQSTPFPGPGSTDPSSHNTPSTQIDSPTPESMDSSDFRHSVSPQPGVPSPKSGVFHCTEPGCKQVFGQLHKLKHHQRYHSKDHKCPYANCGKGFGTKTHLQRHINDRHEKKKKFHCSVQDCDYSRAKGKGFPRKDNWKRHMTKIHNMDQTQLPEPIEVDHEMSET
ncbi:Zinc finger transcription factor ace1 [Tolypocladium paradoxum]|uniref:Zinc finger transcription factor ace1 n=1 Tax=Tolypocladium paradoxum TaxID=94208 RepID=A0A2S4KVF7_9HYPO|nr:Zinc finger transcription factor ace1 [Tolypocladium paradoxum]